VTWPAKSDLELTATLAQLGIALAQPRGRYADRCVHWVGVAGYPKERC
jgi:hypothetical protein